MGHAASPSNSWKIVSLATLVAFASLLGFADASKAASDGHYLRVSSNSVLGPFPKQVAIDSGFLYWTQLQARHGKKRSFVSSVMQRSILTGVTREMFSVKGGTVTNVSAGAGRVAFTQFSMTTLRREPKSVTNTLYSMAATDVKATVLKTSIMKFEKSFQTVKRHGKKRRVKTLISCGDMLELTNVSEIGQILAADQNVACGGRSVLTSKPIVYPPDSVTPTRVPIATDDFAIGLSDNLLLINGADGRTLVSRNFTTGAELKLPVGGFAVSTATAPDGHVAVITRDINFIQRKTTSKLMIFPPDSTTASSTVAVDTKANTDIVFCGDTLLQVSGKRKGLTKLTLRDFAGNVVTEIDGPPARNYASATCSGRHVLAAGLYKTGPALSEYDL